MTELSDRLLRRVTRDYAGDELLRVSAKLAAVRESIAVTAQQDPERLQAAIVLAADGDYETFVAQFELAKRDWRDVLNNAGLAESDWPKQLEAALGSNPPNFWDNRWLAWRTRRAMHRGARAAVRELKPLGVTRSISCLGFHVDPVVWLVTQQDDERDAFDQETLREIVIRCLGEAGVRADLAAEAGVTVESEETVRRDFEGNWRHAMQ